MTILEMVRGLVRAAEMKEQDNGGQVWDDAVRAALAEARRRGWGRHQIGSLEEIGQSGETIPVEGPRGPQVTRDFLTAAGPIPPLPDRTGGICSNFYGGTHCVVCQRPRAEHGDRLHPLQRLVDAQEHARGICDRATCPLCVEPPTVTPMGNLLDLMARNCPPAPAELCGEAHTTAGGAFLRCINPKGHHGGHDDPPYSWGWRP